MTERTLLLRAGSFHDIHLYGSLKRFLPVCVRVLHLEGAGLQGRRGVEAQLLLQMFLQQRQGPVFSGGVSAGGLQTGEYPQITNTLEKGFILF